MAGIRVQAPQLQAEIMECLKNSSGGKVSEIATYTGIERTVVWRNCKRLLAEGKLSSTEDRHGVIYSLNNSYATPKQAGQGSTIASKEAGCPYHDRKGAGCADKMVSHGRGRR
jgi:hypothetical protein